VIFIHGGVRFSVSGRINKGEEDVESVLYVL